MSKFLKVSKHKLDLAAIELTGPSLLIGRSPLCDQVLRAPGIRPVHFLLEWIGEGEFDSNKGMWTLFDIAHLISPLETDQLTDATNTDFGAEGIIIDNKQRYMDFNWRIVEDRIKSTSIQRGVISDQLLASANKNSISRFNNLALEIVCLSKVDQVVKEVWHFFDQKININLKNKLIPFEISWSLEAQAEFIFKNMPSAILNLKGQKIQIDDGLKLLANETFIIHLSDEIYFVRFVNRVQYVSNKFEIFKNKFWITSVLSLFIFSLLLFGINKADFSKSQNEIKPILRIVKIIETEPLEKDSVEKNEQVEAELAVAEPVLIQNKEDQVLAEKNENLEEVSKKSSKNIGSIESSIVPDNLKNTPVPLKNELSEYGKNTDVNTVGLLGKLKKNSKTSGAKAISAEAISQTFIDDTASTNDQKGVLVPTAQMGILGMNNDNIKNALNQRNHSDSNLIEAQTTLKGAKDLSANSTRPLATTGGLKDNYTVVSGKENKAFPRLGSAGGDNIEVIGGLTKSQVYDVINSHRREIRTCFESALVVRNDLNGILRLSFTINLAGYVNDIKVVNSELNSNILENCVIQVIRQMKFPESPNQLSTTVIYPFAFKQSS